MASTGAVWGIDIGNCALKALRCRPHERDLGRLVVEGFDYVEYPKLLSQPDSDREELIREAIATFLSRNDLTGDRVAMSVPGQSGLARFIKLPPVEAKKIPDIVRYEARQQIPFTLEDVVWDYQPLRGGNQDEGYALETEVGLFAMKRDQVSRALAPLDRAGIEVEIVQLAPLAIYNFITFDRFGDLGDKPYDPDNPPPSIIVLSLGTDATDIVITNGFRVWQRSIPIGGSHFTKALTKELRLTFSNAEHLKRNPRKAEDPKALFQAMRPVFSDLVREVQKSLGFYMSNNRKATLSEIVALGNPMKLPGLERFLSENLEQTVQPVTKFEALAGGSVTDSPQFRENRLAFAVAYGLCVQALGKAELSTNLLPEEIVTTRLIRAKKPWAVTAAAALLLGFAASYASYVSAWKTVDVKSDWESAITKSKGVKSTADGFASTNSTLKDQFTSISDIGQNLQSNAEGRLQWLELLKAIDAAVPKDDRPEAERQKTADDVTQRPELHIESVDCEFYPDLASWYGNVQPLYEEMLRSDKAMAERIAKAAKPAPGQAPPTKDGEDASEEADPAEGGAVDGGDESVDPAVVGSDAESEGAEEGEAGAPAGPTGEGWVVQLVGHHFHNSDSTNPNNKIDRNNESELFVRKTLISNLVSGKVDLPDGPNGETVPINIRDLGIDFPVVVTKWPIASVNYDPEAASQDDVARSSGGGDGLFDSRGGGGGFGPGGLGGGLGAANPGLVKRELWKLRRYDFIVQFVWQPRTRSMRQEAALAASEESAAEEGTVEPSASAPAGILR